MQLYLLPSKVVPELRKNTLGKNKFFGYQKERIIICQQASWPEDDVKPLRPLHNFIWSTWLWQGSGLLTPRDSVFIPMYNKKYISKPENKENGSVSGKTDSPVSFFLSPSGWIPIWSVDARHVYLLALASKTHVRGSPRQGTLHYSSECQWPT